MEDNNVIKQRVHKCMLSGRKSCVISGILDVLSFDLSEIMLETELGMLQIKGCDLHVSRLTLEKGEIDIDGKIDALIYSEAQNKAIKTEGLLGRLFK